MRRLWIVCVTFLFGCGHTVTAPHAALTTCQKLDTVLDTRDDRGNRVVLTTLSYYHGEACK